MKNITVSLDDETYRRARIKAAERDSSVSALVKEFLVKLGSTESKSDILKREERSLRERITNFSAGDRLPRDEVHGRDR
jgi:plasmid stability protein